MILFNRFIRFFPVDLYTPSVHLHQNLMHHHGQYQHENLSLSPQQSSTSDADETLTPPPSLNRMGVSAMERMFFEKEFSCRIIQLQRKL